MKLISIPEKGTTALAGFSKISQFFFTEYIINTVLQRNIKYWVSCSSWTYGFGSWECKFCKVK